MAGRSPARFLAPIALVAFGLALFIVVSNTTRDGGEETGAQGTSAPAEATPTPKAERKRRTRKTYTVKAGDTPSGISVKVGIPLDQIYELNPDLDPQALAPGTKIKLR
jgi:LysM repeat protein